MAVNGRRMVLIGGGLSDSNGEVYNEIVRLAGGKGIAKIGIISAASVSESQDPYIGTSQACNSRVDGQYYGKLFKGTYDVLDAQWIPIDMDNINNNENQQVINQINSMTGFFFTGGDQRRLINCFRNSDGTDSFALAAIKRKYEDGAVVAGSSAGAAVLAGYPMITGGESYNAMLNGAYTTVSRDELSYEPRGGFGLFSYGILDTHFSERGRQGRVIRLAFDTSGTMAYGVDENTALVVTNADTNSVEMEVLGQNGVFIFDLSKAYKGTDSFWSLYNIITTYLTKGDKYNPLTKQIIIAGWKTALSGRECGTYAAVTEDIFSSLNNIGMGGVRKNPREFVRVSTSLFASRLSMCTYGRTYERNGAYEVKMAKSSILGSEAYHGYDETGMQRFSYKYLNLDIYKC
ncbi:MAG: cyanophycinase [Clostridia bacterium]|nr:cyanophycinase [Clostridia bacterium]